MDHGNLKEHDTVLTKIELWKGSTRFRVGTVGTVVSVLDEGRAYRVELRCWFCSSGNVLTVLHGHLAPATVGRPSDSLSATWEGASPLGEEPDAPQPLGFGSGDPLTP